MAVHIVRDVVWAERDILENYDDHDPRSHVEVCTLLEYAVHRACEEIHQKAKVEPEKRGTERSRTAEIDLERLGGVLAIERRVAELGARGDALEELLEVV